MIKSLADKENVFIFAHENNKQQLEPRPSAYLGKRL